MMDTKGLPTGVQIASRRWHDEKALRVMKEVEGVREWEE